MVTTRIPDVSNAAAKRGGRSERPTPEQFAAYQAMFDHFNARLFGAALLPPVILNFSRKAKTGGFFAPHRWDNGKEQTHEISLNPEYLKRPAIDVASTLAHEMVHLWQFSFGKPSRRGYHNQEWADKMEVIGLMPSDTGEPGGNRVGHSMTHYIIDDGPFARSFNRLPQSARLPWSAVEEPDGRKNKKSSANKTKYTCPDCDANVWGKPDLAIICGECSVSFEADE